jgi:hypothetical protein
MMVSNAWLIWQKATATQLIELLEDGSNVVIDGSPAGVGIPRLSS